MPKGLLDGEGRRIGRRHVRALMKRLGIAAIHRRPNSSKRAPGRRIHPHPLG
jgi:putative transposase